MAILILNLADLVPSLDRHIYSHLKMVTSSSFSQIVAMSALVWVVLFTMIFDFSVLIGLLEVAAGSTHDAMSSANLELEICLPQMELEA
ncbi:hypothetical protein DPMN_093972 [Dreissena polymorpha]|uniref:Uncharacterized protein n=1 Tax=Dreissena polymorpha TaxID=45954 RepID=A0A9D4R329_DREPO|nr:hypothetical protein DPMN_093972 [Dreissena polymorpha]